MAQYSIFVEESQVCRLSVSPKNLFIYSHFKIHCPSSAHKGTTMHKIFFVLGDIRMELISKYIKVSSNT